MTIRSLVWFRGKELRVSDHAPLATAARDGEVIAVFVLDPYFFAPERARRLPHRVQFLLESITSLEQNLAHLGSRLLVVRGKSVDVIPRLAEAWQVDRVLSQRWTEPVGRERDRRIAAALPVPFVLLGGETLLPPATLRTGVGTPYSVFTAFARAFAEHERAARAPLPRFGCPGVRVGHRSAPRGPRRRIRAPPRNEGVGGVGVLQAAVSIEQDYR